MRIVPAIAAMFLASAAVAADIHGETDAFSRDGVALAWAISRGKDEAGTMVVVRVATDTSIKSVTVKGQDPFTKAEKVLVAARPIDGGTEIRLPRAGFADFPRTEWDFLGADGQPKLRVYYLGIPDTTPEFPDEQRLAAYLTKRVAK